VVAGEIGDPVRSRGRSRHGTAIDRRADSVEYSGRQRAPPDAGVHQVAALMGVGTTHLHHQLPSHRPRRTENSMSEKGEHLAPGPVPPTVPPLRAPVQIDASKPWLSIARQPMWSALGSTAIFQPDSRRDDWLHSECDPGSVNGSEKRVLAPRTQSRRGPSKQKGGGSHAPGSTARWLPRAVGALHRAPGMRQRLSRSRLSQGVCPSDRVLV
jgi:hypothetical protein